ncbi:MAG: helix-turn-helix domain-containing protein [Syntrophales bacterium]|nr:helix-turn-helix domain-containing protein [Syntrophales bacterium]
MHIKKDPLSNDLWSWIKHRLTIKGYPSFRALGKAYKYSDGAFKNVKNYSFPATQKIIADIIGTTPQELFPNRYTPEGKPIGRNYPRDRRITKHKISCNGKDLEENCHET